ncbi:MAG: phosphoglycerate kinase [Gemmatimonadota bacterium]|nr:phosphoglycerate kinase [Gemmatimonadota bacterium]
MGGRDASVRPARRTLDDLTAEEADGRRALVRVDFNVPLEGDPENRYVASDARIRASLSTVEGLLGRGATVVLASHLGRPAGAPDPALSLKPVAAHVEELLGRRIVFLPEPFDERSTKIVREARGGEVFLLENLRFHPGEKGNDPAFAERLAGYGEYFVQDAFGTCHRAHASTVGVTEFLRPRVAGRLLARELEAFGRVLDPERPFVAIMGGAKIADKIGVVEELAERSERVCLGGGMANTFLEAKGIDVGDSLVEEDRLDRARALIDRFGEALVLPVDAVIAREIEVGAETRTVSVDDGIDPGWKILDVGPATVERFERALRDARTVFWNGPLGVFETPPFDAATRAIAERLAAMSERGAYTVTGGGDSLAALERAGLAESVGHASTGGGAALDLVAGKTLPGVESLDPAPGAASSPSGEVEG